MSKPQQIEHILTPETEKHFFTDQILPPLLRGENVTIMWVPHGGMRTQMLFLSEHSDSFGYKALGNYKIVYVNPYELTEESPEGYLSLILYSHDPQNYIKDNNKSSFLQLKEKVIGYLKDGLNLVIILGGFEQHDFSSTLYNNLHSLWQLNKTNIHFIFAASGNILSSEKINKYDQLQNLLTQNIVYFPNLSFEDVDFVSKRLMAKYGYCVTDNVKNMVFNLCGGHLDSLRICLKLLNDKSLSGENDITSYLSDQMELKVLFNDIWGKLTEHEKVSLIQLINKTFSDHFKLSDYLINTKMVCKSNSQYTIFSPIFETFILQKPIVKNSLEIDKKNGEILLNGFPVKEKVTLHEYQLLAAFLGKPNEIITRDEVAEVLWGKENYDKYSEWAIDQNLSLLRKKIEILGISPSCLQTIKGRGYRWLP